jgi:hypothetical protein
MTKSPFEYVYPNNPTPKKMFESSKFIGGFSDRVRIVEFDDLNGVGRPKWCSG